ncbi:MAG: DUF4347 domain-containing protein [Rhodomicrobium sp.]|nr:DUF4347 domain-containing protein [Rhodomicrobium sp.]
MQDLISEVICFSANINAEKEESPSTQNQSIIFIDHNISTLSKLFVQNYKCSSELFFLSPKADGIAQIAGFLKHRPKRRSVHVFSHMPGGRLALAGRLLTARDLHRRARDLAPIGRAIAPGGELILGAGEEGGKQCQHILGFLEELLGVRVRLWEPLAAAP